MSYSIYIQRPEADISLEEWLAAASKLQCVRVHEGPVELGKSQTGERITFNNSAGNLDVATPEGWFTAFCFSKNSGFFKGTPEVESPLHPVHSAAWQLAKLLDAELIGDDGERYDWGE